ncbi:MAG TPA: hypothetical protein VFH56_04205 [Acidimicrobiales bacterium]|nr:hypothetical protein [Acidimicrobiales bacterium]
MYLDLFDEQPEEFLGLLGALGRNDLVELVGEAGEVGRVGRCVRLCGEGVGEVGFLVAQDLQPGTVAAEAVLAVGGCEAAVFEGFEVALELRLQPDDLGARGGELLFDPGPFAFDVLGGVGECSFDEAAVAVEVGELCEDGGFEPVLREPVAFALARPVLVAGGAGVVGVAAVSAVG